MAVAAPSRALTARSAVDLARAIREREVSSREVVEAHIEVCRRAHPHINAIVVDRYEAALADADDADARVAAAADPDELPPLLGVPCTIKEAIAFAGMPNCAGLVSRGTFRSVQSAPAVQRLLDAGAIPLARRAEDLIPFLRVIAGPDGIDPYAREATIGDPADVSISGMRILLSEDTSFIPVSRELRAAQLRAAEVLEQAGAKLETVSLRSMSARWSCTSPC